MCFRPYILGARHVFMMQEKPRRESVADVKKICYLSLPSVNIQTLRIDDINPDPYFSDEEVQYLLLDKIIKTEVLTARNNQIKLTLGLSKELLKQILRRRIERENN